MPDDRSSQHDDRRRSQRDSPEAPSRRRRSLSPTSTTPHPTLLRFNAPSLTPDDYFSRSYEFKCWLSSKSLYLDELSSDRARRYFSRFVRYWNTGRLADEFYTGQLRGVGGSGGQTRHKWGFAANNDVGRQLDEVRDSVDTLTNGTSRGAKEARDAERKSRSRAPQHPDEGAAQRDSGWSSRPVGESHADRQLDREHDQDIHRIAQQQSRQRVRQDAIDANEALHARATGRDRIAEKRREKNAANRAFADRHDDGFEMDDSELYDDLTPRTTSSLAREGSKRQQARREKADEKRAELNERVGKMKQKDDQTMEMFKRMAAERFGGAG